MGGMFGGGGGGGGGAGGLGSAVGSIFGTVAAMEAAKTLKKAERNTRIDIDNYNRSGYSLLEASRGGQGMIFNSETGKLEPIGKAGFAFLPQYSTSAAGGAFEPQMWEDTRRVYDASAPADVTRYRELAQPYNRLIGDTQKAIEGLYSGGMAREEMAAMQPVFEARRNAAKAPWLEAVQRILGDIKASNARRGYGGDSFATNLVKARILPNAFSALPQAELQNAMDAARIKGNDISRRLASINLPMQYAANVADFASMPERAAAGAQNSRNALVKNAFNVGVTAPFQPTGYPGRMAIPSASQIAFEGAGQMVSGMFGGGGGQGPTGQPNAVVPSPVYAQQQNAFAVPANSFATWGTTPSSSYTPAYTPAPSPPFNFSQGASGIDWSRGGIY